ncbi:conjugal transfer protein TraQ, partial [Phocaeicola vulgatus]
MNIPDNKNKRTSFFKALALCLFAAMSFTSVS